MHAAGHGLSESARVKLREVVSTIDAEISSLSRGRTTEECRRATGELLVSWAELVKLLELGLAPEVRACPNCKRIIMAEATRCGYCWTEVSPFHKDDVSPPAVAGAARA
jgi:hypothetical protein